MSAPGPPAPLPALDEVRRRLGEVRRRIERAGGDPDLVRVCAVTKGFGIEAARLAVDAGLVDLGENYAQELVAKASLLADVRWHMIGPVQRNKVRRLAPHVWCWQTVDRVELATEIATRAPGARVLIQVNATSEAQKAGVNPEGVPQLAGMVREAGLDLRGLMALGPTDPGVDPAPGFALVARLARDLEVPELSMGMTRDLEAAVAAGATMVRVGTALFGPRPTGGTVR
jgi:PLP dependent protein